MNERYKLNAQLAQMLKGGVIMDVTTLEQARIAEAAGACAVMALEKIPADIRAAGGVATPADAAGCRGRIRRLRYFQIRRPGKACAGHC